MIASHDRFERGKKTLAPKLLAMAANTSLSWLPGTAKFCGLSLVPVALLLLLSVGVLYFRLLQGPVSLTFLIDSVEQGINNELTGLDSSIDDFVVTLTDSGALEFRLENLRFSEPDGDLVAAAPQAAMELSYFALLGLRAAPSRVELIEPRLFMSYSEQSGLSLRFSPSDQAERWSQSLPADNSFATDDSIGADNIVPPSPVPAQRPLPGAKAVGEPSGQAMDLSSLIQRVSQRSGRGSGASSYLQEIGLRDATVVLDTRGQTSVWHVPRLSVDLNRADARTIVSGGARISSRGQIWSVSFKVEDASGDGLTLTTSVEGLVPRWIGSALPQLVALKHFDMPVTADGRIDIAKTGAVAGADFKLETGPGSIHLAEFSEVPFSIGSGRFNLSYDAVSQQLMLLPSSLNWGDSSLTLVGSVRRAEGQEGNDAEGWLFEAAAEQGILGASEFGIPPLPVDKWQARGLIAPQQGLIRLDRFEVAAGGGRLSLSGEVTTNGGTAGTRLEAQISPMPVATMKALWPRGIAEEARQWVGRKVQDGTFSGGTYRYLDGYYAAQDQHNGQDSYRMTLAATFDGLAVAPLDGMAPIQLSQTLVRLENQMLEVTAPEGVMAVAADQPLVLNSGRFTVGDVYEAGATGEVAFAAKGSVSTMLALLEMPAFKRIGQPEGIPSDISGEVTAEVTIGFPLREDLNASDASIKAKARLSDGRARDLLGEYDLKGATIDFDLSETAVDAKGEVLIDGVPAKLNWQRIFGNSEAQQPPVRLTATLDEADRRQLGLDLGEAMHGDVAIEVTVQPHHGRPSDVRVRADLTNADVGIDEIAWRKPTGRSAFMEFDLLYEPSGQRKLQNFRLEGDDLSVEGTLELGKKKQIVGFSFPKFWLNLVTRLEVNGKLNSKNVWEIRASGPTYDGRAFFRTLYSIPGARTQSIRERKQRGIDVVAQIDNVLGYGDVNLRGLKLQLSERNGELTALDARGTLSGGKPLTVELLKGKSAGRQMVAKSSDAGQAFKLVGFYPNMIEGVTRLEVNLDGRGPAEKTGILWVENFKVLGDPIISEVAGSADTAGPSIDGGRSAKRRMVREVFYFDRMRAPFSVGHGQFVLEDAYLRGPLQGATIRGKVDYSRQVLELGGTYIPLQGLNNAFGGIPVLGELLSGPRQEGLFGVTYAIQGSMEAPQVVVHPLSVIAPGIFREMFQLTPQAPRVQPRQQRTGNADPSAGVRASSSPPSAGEAGGGVVDGWTSEASPAEK